jgi:C1A family cysteine protease
MAEKVDGRGLGWLRDHPNFRDHTVTSTHVSERRKSSSPREVQAVKDMLKQVGAEDPSEKLPSSVDLREWCPPIENQESIGSCTAHAGVALVEYFEKRAFGKHLDAARLFLYKVTRNLMQQTGDTGAFLRKTMEALVLFGVPPEEYYPYDTGRYDEEPPAFCYSFGQSYKAIDYYRLDPPQTSPQDLLSRIKTNLSVGLPSMFGFTVYSSISLANGSGDIPYPSPKDSVVGGHAVVAVGYDDARTIGDAKGALLIRNSWGTDWGEEGYGWLGYGYVLNVLAVDWWSIVKNEWVDSEAFGE